MKSGRVQWQEAEETRKDFNIVLIRQDKKFFYLRALQGHSGRNLIDPSLQDNVLIPNDSSSTFITSDVQLHMPVDPMNKEHKDLDTVDLKAPAWKKHQNTVLGRFKLAQKKGLKF